ncbi:MAG: hypothetical protein HOW73_29370 [Polyangiaceae bacterium]|nr:hypothetical protein [Polyangiaceae bacterium]
MKPALHALRGARAYLVVAALGTSATQCSTSKGAFDPPSTPPPARPSTSSADTAPPPADYVLPIVNARVAGVAIDARGYSAAILDGVQRDASVGAVAFPNTATDSAGGAVTLIDPTGKVLWTWPVPLTPAAVALGDDSVFAAFSVYRSQTDVPPKLRASGDPGAVLVALDRRTGAPTTVLPLEASEQGSFYPASLLAMPDGGVVIAGNYKGVVKIADRTLSGGTFVSDRGAVIRVSSAGKIVWVLDQSFFVRSLAAGPNGLVVSGLATMGMDTTVRDSIGRVHALTTKRGVTQPIVMSVSDEGRLRWSHTFASSDLLEWRGLAVHEGGEIAIADVLPPGKDVSDETGLLLQNDGPQRQAFLMRISANGKNARAIALTKSGLVAPSSIAALELRYLIGGAAQRPADGDPVPVVVGNQRFDVVGPSDGCVIQVSGDPVERELRVSSPGVETVQSIAASRAGWIAGVKIFDNAGTLVVAEETIGVPENTEGLLVFRAQPPPKPE